MKSKPNYLDLGLSAPMGPQLRREVERQLLLDLAHYLPSTQELRFDWSDSCMEGHAAAYLDGTLENYSSIYLYDPADNLIAEGWMDFALANDWLLIYWDYLDFTDKQQAGKRVFGIPNHVWLQLPAPLQLLYGSDRVKPNFPY